MSPLMLHASLSFFFFSRTLGMTVAVQSQPPFLGSGSMHTEMFRLQGTGIYVLPLLAVQDFYVSCTLTHGEGPGCLCRQ